MFKQLKKALRPQGSSCGHPSPLSPLQAPGAKELLPGEGKMTPTPARDRGSAEPQGEPSRNDRRGAELLRMHLGNEGGHQPPSSHLSAYGYIRKITDSSHLPNEPHTVSPLAATCCPTPGRQNTFQRWERGLRTWRPTPPESHPGQTQVGMSPKKTSNFS